MAPSGSSTRSPGEDRPVLSPTPEWTVSTNPHLFVACRSQPRKNFPEESPPLPFSRCMSAVSALMYRTASESHQPRPCALLTLARIPFPREVNRAVLRFGSGVGIILVWKRLAGLRDSGQAETRLVRRSVV